MGLSGSGSKSEKAHQGWTPAQQALVWEAAERIHEDRGLTDDIWDGVEAGDKEAMRSLSIAERLVPLADSYAVRVLDETQPKPPRLVFDFKQITALAIGLAATAGVGHWAWLEAYSLRDWLDSAMTAPATPPNTCPQQYDLPGARKQGLNDTQIAEWFAAGCPDGGPARPGEDASGAATEPASVKLTPVEGDPFKAEKPPESAPTWLKEQPNNHK